MDEAERLCDRVAIMDHGKVIALGTPRELIASIGVEHMVEFSSRQRGARSTSRRCGASTACAMFARRTERCRCR